MWEAMSAAEPVDRPQCESPVWRVAGISVFTVDACGVCPTCVRRGA